MRGQNISAIRGTLLMVSLIRSMINHLWFALLLVIWLFSLILFLFLSLNIFRQYFKAFNNKLNRFATIVIIFKLYESRFGLNMISIQRAIRVVRIVQLLRHIVAPKVRIIRHSAGFSVIDLGVTGGPMIRLLLVWILQRRWVWPLMCLS